MEYENLPEALRIAKEIKKAETELAELSEYENGEVKLIVTGKNSNKLMTIGAHKSFEHSFSTQAELFVTDCIQLTRAKIARLKTDFESL